MSLVEQLVPHFASDLKLNIKYFLPCISQSTLLEQVINSILVFLLVKIIYNLVTVFNGKIPFTISYQTCNNVFLNLTILSVFLLAKVILVQFIFPSLPLNPPAHQSYHVKYHYFVFL